MESGSPRYAQLCALRGKFSLEMSWRDILDNITSNRSDCPAGKGSRNKSMELAKENHAAKFKVVLELLQKIWRLFK